MATSHGPARPGSFSRGPIPPLLVSCLALFGVARPAAAQQYPFRSYTNTDGLPQRQVFAIHQDRTGYLWFGTYGGVSRYDGAGFLTLDTGQGLSSNTVLDLAEDGAGRLVAATRRGGICVREATGFVAIRKGASLVSNDIQRLARDPDGTLWAATEEGITHLSQPPVHYTTADGLPSSNVHSVLRDRRGRVWAATTKGLALLKDGRFTPVHPEILASSLLRVLLPWGDDLLVAGDGVLLILREGELVPFPAQLPTRLAREIEDATLDAKGTLWLATHDGAFRWDGRTLEHYGRRQGLLSATVHCVSVDREGDVWFGTDEGASKLAPSPFVGYTYEDGLAHSFVRALGEDLDGHLLVGTRAGISVLFGTKFTTVREGLPNERIYSFATLPDRGVLVGTYAGMALLEGTNVRRTFSRADGLPDDYVTSLLTRADGSVVIGTEHGMALFRGGKILRLEDPLLAGAYVLCMREDGLERLWIGLRNGGAVVWDGHSARRLPQLSRLEGETVWSIDRDTRGRMWIGTSGFGVFVVDGTKQTRFTRREGLANDNVWQVLADADGSVWCYTGHGLDRIDGKGITHFGVEDGLLDLEGSTAAALRQRNGELWFGSGTGLSRFVPSLVAKNTVAPPVVVEEVAVGTSPIPPGTRLPHDVAGLRFRYSALSFRNEAAVRFRHRLLPTSTAWSDPSGERRLEIGRPAPGDYVLEVTAENDAGVPSISPARFPFTIRPPWWGTWWFRVALLAGAALLGIGLGSFRRVEADRRRLSRLVAERTAELELRTVELQRLATSDSLTGAATRRHFHESLEMELKRASRQENGGTVSLLLMDVDHFKDVNDECGHRAGDQVLVELAARVQGAIRGTDLLARYGGEEFAVVLPYTSSAGAETIARKVHTVVSGAPYAVEGRELRVTVSIGVSTTERITNWDTGLPNGLIDRADEALYRAKVAGRDRVEVSPPVGENGEPAAGRPA